MTTLVIARSLKDFLEYIYSRYTQLEIAKRNGSGVFVLKNGDDIRYVSSPIKMRGYHGVKVAKISTPDWYDAIEMESLIKLAEIDNNTKEK